MLSLNRYQVVTVCALMVFLWGVVMSVGAFSGRLSFDSLQNARLDSNVAIPLTLEKPETFPKIASNVDRNPFSMSTKWRAPHAESLAPPPFADLLKLVPTPVLLRDDALPRLGAFSHLEEIRADRKIITKLKSLLRSRIQRSR